ncbi:MAG: hypothetical protein ACKPKO_47195, partial [Candidatus Fonsibacter sp.]
SQCVAWFAVGFLKSSMGFEVSAGTCHCHTYLLPIIIGGPALLHWRTLTFAALGVMRSSQKLVCCMNLIVRYGGLGVMILMWRNASANSDFERSCVPRDLDSLARCNMWPKSSCFLLK